MIDSWITEWAETRIGGHSVIIWDYFHSRQAVICMWKRKKCESICRAVSLVIFEV